MQMSTFHGRTLEECYQKVKSQLGRDAVILQERTYKPFFGIGGTRYEVIAADGINIGGEKVGQPNRDQGQSPRPQMSPNGGGQGQP
jgi:flagellar biosynthesis GTPase FlhF